MSISNPNKLNSANFSCLTAVVFISLMFSAGFTSLLAQNVTEKQHEKTDPELASAPNALGNDSTPEVEILSNGNIVITPTIDSHASRIADSELLQSVQQNPDLVIGKPLQFGSGEVIGTILDVKRKIDDLYLYLVVDASAFFKTDATYAVAVRDLWEIKDEMVIMPMLRGMHLKGITYYPEEYVAHDDNFSDQRVDQIFSDALTEDESGQ